MTLRSTLFPEITIRLLRKHSKSLQQIAKDAELLGDTKAAETLRDLARKMYQRANRIERKDF